MNEDVNTRLLKVEHRQETLEKTAHDGLAAQKETSEAMKDLTLQLGRLVDKFDSINENQKEYYKQLKINTSRLDKQESTIKVINGAIGAIVVSAVLVALNLK